MGVVVVVVITLKAHNDLNCVLSTSFGSFDVKSYITFRWQSLKWIQSVTQLIHSLYQQAICLCFRANEKRELETKQRSATAADPQTAAAASVGAAANSTGQTDLHELKKHNDELEDEVS